MKDTFKKLVFLLMAVLMFMATACGYSSVASHTGRLYVAKNDLFLFGALRAVYVCTESGNKINCQKAGKP